MQRATATSLVRRSGTTGKKTRERHDHTPTPRVLSQSANSPLSVPALESSTTVSLLLSLLATERALTTPTFFPPAVPFVIPFETRVAIFRQFIQNDRKRLGIESDRYDRTRRHRAVVRRNHLSEDSFARKRDFPSLLSPAS